MFLDQVELLEVMENSIRILDITEEMVELEVVSSILLPIQLQYRELQEYKLLEAQELLVTQTTEVEVEVELEEQ